MASKEAFRIFLLTFEATKNPKVVSVSTSFTGHYAPPAKVPHGPWDFGSVEREDEINRTGRKTFADYKRQGDSHLCKVIS